jgi:hypothetical protein
MRSVPGGSGLLKSSRFESCSSYTQPRACVIYIHPATPLSVNQLAKALGIGAARLNEIVRGERGITADTALRLARYFRTNAEF